MKSDTHCSIITILNYDGYQSITQDEVTGRVTGKGQASDTNKNDKNDKNLKNGRKKESDPRVKEFFDFWMITFQRETGQPYVFSFGKDGKLVKDLLKVHSPETLHEAARASFKNEQCRRRGLNIGILFQEINTLIGLKGMNPLEQAKREAQEKREFEEGML